MAIPDREPTHAATSDGQSSDSGITNGDSGRGPGDEQDRGRTALDEATKDHLLSVVLSETMTRRHDDPAELLRSLRSWRESQRTDEFDQSSCEGMVGRVLDYRLGAEAKSIPNQLRQEVGDVLWNNPESQTRLRRLWTSLLK